MAVCPAAVARSGMLLRYYESNNYINVAEYPSWQQKKGMAGQSVTDSLCNPLCWSILTKTETPHLPAWLILLDLEHGPRVERRDCVPDILASHLSLSRWVVRGES